MLLPPRGELKILFSPGSQINKVLGFFQIIKKKKKKKSLQLSNQIDWWVVLSTGSLYLASDAKTGGRQGVCIENASTSEQAVQISIIVFSEAGITAFPDTDYLSDHKAEFSQIMR